MARSSLFYTYVDLTSDGRPFYVGKGNRARVRGKERNVLWKNIVRKHGYARRIIVFETMCEVWALERETELIALLKTHHGQPGHWGANLTSGGEGLGEPESLRRRRKSISEAQTGSKNHQFGHKHTELHKQRISDSLRGEKNPFFGRSHTSATRSILSRKSMGNKSAQGVLKRGKRHTCKLCGEVGHYSVTCVKRG